MARYHVANSPVKYWNGAALLDGFMYNRGVWVEGRGYFCCCSSGVSGAHAIGWLQLDGVFCPSETADLWKEFTMNDDVIAEEDRVLASESRVQNRTHVHDVILHMGSYRYSSDWPGIFGKVNKVQPLRQGRAFARINDGTAGSLLSVLDGCVATNDIANPIYSFNWTKVTADLWDPLPTNPDNCTVSWKEDELFYIFHESGRGVLYDHSTQTVVRNDLWVDDLSAFHSAQVTYCREHDWFMVICRDSLISEPGSGTSVDPLLLYYDRSTYMRIYVNAGKPTSISTPQLVAPITVGTVATVEVTVTGAQGDAVEEVLVDWTITAGDGSLTLTQSATDANGVASTGYIPPATDGGSVTIEAEVTY